MQRPSQDCQGRPSVACWRDHSIGAPRRRSTPIPRGRRPSMATFTRLGARKAGDIAAVRGRQEPHSHRQAGQSFPVPRVPLKHFFSFTSGPAAVSPELSWFFSSLKRQDIRFLELWCHLKDRRTRSTILNILKWLPTVRLPRGPASPQALN
jgi:hypothetical protein